MTIAASVNPPLSELGQQQAAAVGARLADHDFVCHIHHTSLTTVRAMDDYRRVVAVNDFTHVLPFQKSINKLTPIRPGVALVFLLRCDDCVGMQREPPSVRDCRSLGLRAVLITTLVPWHY